jgi:nicotinate-nucleotide--dimethylbenzimidazole phosphoribosyltransferase
LAKPQQSLGRLETLACRLAAAQGKNPPRAERLRAVVFAGDHGVVVEGVSPYPQAVTRLMVQTFAAGKAAVSVLARAAGADLEVVDVGVIPGGAACQTPAGVRVVVAEGAARPTGNIANEPAMSAGEMAAALLAGHEAALRAAEDGIELLAVGEMGIGNTTAASALAAKWLGRDPAEVCGPGTGLDTQGVAHKASVVARAVARCPYDADDSAAVLADLGGSEIAAMAGCMLAAASRRIPVLVDGFICSVAALAAVRLVPAVRPYLIPTTLSTEPGHRAVLAALDIGEPLLALDLRLGEASGAALAFPIARAACRVVAEMATLADVLGQSPA